MEHLSGIRVKDEQFLYEHLKGEFSVECVNQILSAKDAIEGGNNLSAIVKGYTFQVSEKFGSSVYLLCREVASKLGLSDLPVEFYICNDPTQNALAFYSFNEAQPHSIVLHSAVVEKLSPEELRFVVGHEFGHLIYGHSVLDRVVNLTYKNPDDMPPSPQCLVDLWRKLGEISADRVGLLACESLDAALSAMFMLSSGMSMRSLGMDAGSYLAMVDSQVLDLNDKKEFVLESHPANPVRAKALEIFNDSALYRTWLSEGVAPEDADLEEKIDNACLSIKKVPKNEREQAQLNFLAVAGFLLWTHSERNQETKEVYLQNVLSCYHFWPRNHFDQYFPEQTEEAQSDEALDKCMEAAYKKAEAYGSLLAESYPDLTRQMLAFLVQLVTRGNRLEKPPLEMLLKIGTEYLRIPEAEIVSMVFDGLNTDFKPLM